MDLRGNPLGQRENPGKIFRIINGAQRALEEAQELSPRKWRKRE